MSDLPDYVAKYFWGDDVAELSWKQNKKYIVETLLNRGDERAIEWLFQNVEKKDITTELEQYKLEPKSANYWKLVLT